MAEYVTLDPSELAGTRTPLDISPWVSSDGIDWGDGEIGQYLADQDMGSVPVDFRIPNRNITVPLKLRAIGGTSFATARLAVQAKVALLQQRGGWLKRVTASGGTVFADVVNASVKLSGGWSQANKDFDVEASLTLEALPDFYGSETTLSDHVETTAAELVFTETSVSGDYPARVRLVVDDDQGQSQLGLMWGFRRTNYSSATTARLAYEAEALEPLDTATRGSLTGASGGTVVTHGTLSTNWTPVLSMRSSAGVYPTHVGTYRWRARYRTTSGTAVQLRGVWDVGDTVLPVENDRWIHPAGTAGTAFYAADLGEIRLDQPPVGTHRWNGIIQARAGGGTADNVSIDRVWFQPIDESAGVLRAPINTDPGLVAYSDRDEFFQTSGTLTGKTSAGGKVWAGAGDASIDWNTGSGQASRTVTSGDLDADLNTGRYAVSGQAAAAAQAVQMDMWRDSATSGDVRFGVIARYTDTSNWLLGHVLIDDASTDKAYLCVTKRVAGTVTELDRVQITEQALGAGATFMGGVTEKDKYRMRLAVDAAGRWFLYWGLRGTAQRLVLYGQDSVLATGGTLASGKPGLYVAKTSGSTNQFFVANFLAWALNLDAVIPPSQSLEMRWDGMYRKDVSGSAYGPVSWVESDLPRLPPTLGGTTEVFVKASRGDLLTLADDGIDDISGRITYRPCWIFVPGS